MKKTGNQLLIDTLREWGVNCYFGLNGGGIIHITKYLEPVSYFTPESPQVPSYFTVNEYIAGFCPIGFYLESHKISATLVTTGAATKLASSGMSDAKYLNIPAIYLVALNSFKSTHKSPLQDVSEHGMNIVKQLQDEFGDDCIVIEDIKRLREYLEKAALSLSESRPVVICFYPDILSEETSFVLPKLEFASKIRLKSLNKLYSFIVGNPDRRYIIYVCTEASYYEDIQEKITELSEVLQAPVVWSVNGANAVSPHIPLGKGYILLGGNDESLKIWNSLNKNDVLITFGFDSGEYCINLQTLPVGDCFTFTNLKSPYGHIDHSHQHRIAGNLQVLEGDISAGLSYLLKKIGNKSERSSPERGGELSNLNSLVQYPEPEEGFVDIASLYGKLNQLWHPESIGFDDVCIAYRDRQRIMQRPHPDMQFYSSQDGSAMGSAFGLGIGAKLANMEKHVFVFSGDGCWRLYAGALAETAHLGINLFIFNNAQYSIVARGLDIILPEMKEEDKHCLLPPIDFIKAAQAYGWKAYKLKPDLSNLESLVEQCYRTPRQSILIDIEVDPHQVIGRNMRLENLKTTSYL